MAMKLCKVASNWYNIYKDICKIQGRILGNFEHTGCSEPNGKLALGVLPSAL